MSKDTRIYDKWVGKCRKCGKKSGIVVKGSSDVFINNLKEGRFSDTTICTSGHIGYISSGSQDSFDNNLKTAKIGDSVSGNNIGFLVSGSPDVEVD